VAVSILWQFLYWGWVVSEVGILVATRTRHSSGDVRDRGSLAVLWLTIVASLIAGIWIGRANAANIFRGALWVRYLSIGLLIAGLIIRWIAILSLGKSFSANVAIHATQRVYKSGLFRFVRHPSYSGLLLIFTSIGLYTLNWLGFAVVILPCTGALLYRIQVEEAALSAAFGVEYAEYSQTTKRLIPAIY
jgi:protein-S-isoprenylcysteine O-methyltransferase Ste14